MLHLKKKNADKKPFQHGFFQFSVKGQLMVIYFPPEAFEIRGEISFHIIFRQGFTFILCIKFG